jgi:hypothetical protein
MLFSERRYTDDLPTSDTVTPYLECWVSKHREAVRAPGLTILFFALFKDAIERCIHGQQGMLNII